MWRPVTRRKTSEALKDKYLGKINFPECVKKSGTFPGHQLSLSTFCIASIDHALLKNVLQFARFGLNLTLQLLYTLFIAKKNLIFKFSPDPRRSNEFCHVAKPDPLIPAIVPERIVPTQPLGQSRANESSILMLSTSEITANILFKTISGRLWEQRAPRGAATKLTIDMAKKAGTWIKPSVCGSPDVSDQPPIR